MQPDSIMEKGIGNFNSDLLRPLFESFRTAWADQRPRINLSYDLFVKRIFFKLNIYDEVSLLAFRDHKIAGFILHTLNVYKGTLCAYNGGTGVIPEARGEGITKKLYRELIPRLKSMDVKHIVLEVEKTNSKAIHIYEDLGFKTVTEYHCYAKRSSFHVGKKLTFNIQHNLKEEYQKFWDSEPSFLDQPQQLQYNLENEIILEAETDGMVTGYIVFQPKLGRISQLAVNPTYRRKGIGTALVVEAFQQCMTSSMTVMNISVSDTGFNAFLKRIGFFNEIDQYEMQMMIN